MFTDHGRQLPETLYYVIWFNIQSENYEPLAVFNTKAEADGYVESAKLWAESNNKRNPTFTIMTWTWSEFCAFAQNTKIQPPEVHISLPELWTQDQIKEFEKTIKIGLNGVAEKIKVLP